MISINNSEYTDLGILDRVRRLVVVEGVRHLADIWS